jgi:hypothetical protein
VSLPMLRTDSLPTAVFERPSVTFPIGTADFS